MTTFFSVDVETSATNPFEGYLLTVGIQPVRFDQHTLRVDMAPSSLYVRIDRSWELSQTDWETSTSDTRKWWDTQSQLVRDEAWADATLVRHDETMAARMITEYVHEVETDPAQRIFVANPVAFDKAWIDRLYGEVGMDSPFHYRSLCLRSMKFGLRAASAWGSDRENHDPLIAHHALYDAVAQAHDLISMLNERDRPVEA